MSPEVRNVRKRNSRKNSGLRERCATMWTLAFLVAVATIIFWYLRCFQRHSALFPTPTPGPVVNTPVTTTVKAPRVPREPVNVQLRAPVVLYGTLTGTSKTLATNVADAARSLFGLEFRLVALENYE
jgi:sulfite reductase alpha subunit-like flavoprotein